jgi:hypothetical protein
MTSDIFLNVLSMNSVPNSPNSRFWQSVSTGIKSGSRSTFFVVSVMTGEQSSAIDTALNGDGTNQLYFDKDGNILAVNTTLDGGVEKRTFIKNPLTDEDRKNTITEGMRTNNSFADSIRMTYIDPNRRYTNDQYYESPQFTDRDIIMCPSLKWILFNDSGTYKLLYNPIQAKNFKDYCSNDENYTSAINMARDYCRSLMTNRKNDEDINKRQCFVDPTCNAYYTDNTCINSKAGINMEAISSFGNKDQNASITDFIGEIKTRCLCDSPALDYNPGSNKYYDKDDTFLESVDTEENRGNFRKDYTDSMGTNCNVPLTYQLNDCRIIIDAGGNVNIKDSEIGNECINTLDKASCADFEATCPQGQRLVKNPQSIPDPSEERCCANFCIDFTCPDGKVLMDNSETAEGNDADTCCRDKPIDAKLCKDFSACPDGMKLKDKSNSIVGDDVDKCCVNKLCRDFECPEGMKLRTIFGDKPLEGNTSGECCVPKTCGDFKGTCDSGTQLVSDPENVTGSTKDRCCVNKPCPGGGNCSNNGKCNGGTCDCDDGYSGDGCEKVDDTEPGGNWISDNKVLLGAGGVLLIVFLLILWLTGDKASSTR